MDAIGWLILANIGVIVSGVFTIAWWASLITTTQKVHSGRLKDHAKRINRLETSQGGQQ